VLVARPKKRAAPAEPRMPRSTRRGGRPGNNTVSPAASTPHYSSGRRQSKANTITCHSIPAFTCPPSWPFQSVPSCGPILPVLSAFRKRPAARQPLVPENRERIRPAHASRQVGAVEIARLITLSRGQLTRIEDSPRWFRTPDEPKIQRLP